MTTVTLFGGWWGILSFFLTPIILVANVVQYLGAKEAFRSGRAGLHHEGALHDPGPGSVGVASLPPRTEIAAGGAPQKGLAIASLVLGLLGFACFGLFGVVSLVAVVLGFVALHRVARQPERYGGRGLALGGIATGGLGLAIAAVFWVVALLAASAPPPDPTRSAFDAASRQIDVYSDAEAFGNTEEARAMAQRFSRLMKSLDRIAFTGQGDRGPSLSQGHFLTYVELREDRGATSGSGSGCGGRWPTAPSPPGWARGLRRRSWGASSRRSPSRSASAGLPARLRPAPRRRRSRRLRASSGGRRRSVVAQSRFPPPSTGG
jgi:hypothetical protein